VDWPALQSLIAGHETLTLEFKDEQRRPLNDRDLVEAVVCLTNAASDAVARSSRPGGQTCQARDETLVLLRGAASMIRLRSAVL
jgi:ATP-dependent DNA helicase RecG